MTDPIWKCYDCGSTLKGHHTVLCEMAGKRDSRDLRASTGSQHWDKSEPMNAATARNHYIAQMTRKDRPPKRRDSGRPMMGLTQQRIMAYLEDCGERGGVINSGTKDERFRGLDLEQVERSLEGLKKRNLIYKEGIFWKIRKNAI